MMDTIEILINRFIRYMSKLGLEEWRLQIIFLILIIWLILIVIRKWMTRARLIHKMRDRDHRNIIGKRLYERGAHLAEVKDSREHRRVSVPPKPVKEEKPDCKLSASEWEKTKEQIRQLQLEVTKHKQTEEHLRQVIDELKKANPETLNEITERDNIEQYIRPESFMAKNIDLQIPEVNQSEQADKDPEKQSNDNTAVNEESIKDIAEDVQAGNGTKESGQLHTKNQDRGDAVEDKKDDASSQQPGSPLDVNELKAIAEIAKQLGGNNQRRQ